MQQAPSSTGEFSFSNTLQTIDRAGYGGNYAAMDAGADLRTALNQKKHVQFADAARVHDYEPQYRIHSQSHHHQPTRDYNQQQRGFGHHQQPQQSRTQFSFTKTLSDVQKAENAFSKPSLFGGTSTVAPATFGHQQQQFGAQGHFGIGSGGGRALVSYDDIEMEGGSQPQMSAQTSSFGNQSAFGGAPSSQFGQQPPTGFGAQQQQVPNVTGDDDGRADYTPLTSLTQEELDAFKADHFAFGKIPLNAPPLEMCR